MLVDGRGLLSYSGSNSTGKGERRMEDHQIPASPAPARDAQMQNTIVSALQDRQFFICLQPKFRLPDRHIVGAEALLRWNDPEEGILFPAEFLPAAQRIGYLEALDLYALEEACHCIQHWRAKHMPVVPISVNISVASLHAPGFCDAAVDCLSRHGIPRSDIEFELSYQFAQQHAAKLSDMIECLHRYGFSCCIDGFTFTQDGNLLEHLSAFEIDSVKLNCRSYPDKPMQVYISACAQAVSRAKELGMQLFCEGVERPQQIEALASAGCTLMQGYALSMPVSTGLFAKMLSKFS